MQDIEEIHESYYYVYTQCLHYSICNINYYLGWIISVTVKMPSLLFLERFIITVLPVKNKNQIKKNINTNTQYYMYHICYHFLKMYTKHVMKIENMRTILIIKHVIHEKRIYRGNNIAKLLLKYAMGYNFYLVSDNSAYS